MRTRLNWMRWCFCVAAVTVVLQFAVIVWLLLASGLPIRNVAAQERPDVLRLRGLIIEDEQGHARILLGSPFPADMSRIRTDQRTSAMVFLDADGHDRLTVGEELNPQIGGKVPAGIHRIATGYGVVLHDNIGDERGAYSWLANGRALLTLDRPGAEAFAAIVNDKTGEAKIAFSVPSDITGDASAIELGTKQERAFLDFKSKTGATIGSLQTIQAAAPLQIVGATAIPNSDQKQNK